MRRVPRGAMIASSVCVALLATSCGSDDDDAATTQSVVTAATTAATAAPATTAVTSSSAAPSTDAATTVPAELTSIVVAAPAPGCAFWWPFLVAEDKGFFAEEGLTVSVEGLDGSGALLQALLAGQVDMGLPGPGNFLQAVLEGADLVSVYAMYQNQGLSLVVPEDSEITTLADLKGTTIGVSALDGGAPPFLRGLLADEEGFAEGEDYELLAVGGGANALIALDGGDADAYASYFDDIAIMKLQGAKVRDLIAEGYETFFDSSLVVPREMVDEQPDVIKGFGRALARGTEYGFDHFDEITDITNPQCPEEAADPDLTAAYVEGISNMLKLPPEAEGKWGYADPDSVNAYIDFLVASGELTERPDPGLFTNQFVDDFNNF